MTLTAANLWRRNPDIEGDLRLLLTPPEKGLALVGMQEGANHHTLIARIARENGWNLAMGGTRLHRQNPVAIHGAAVESIRFIPGARAVAEHPARSITRVRYTAAGHPRTIINTHNNAAIEGPPGVPASLPRVPEAIRHIQVTEATAASEMDQGRSVIIMGDFNWHHTEDDARDWEWSPEAMFDRLGMVCNYDHPLHPRGGSLPGGRRVDYIAWCPDDLRVVDIEWVDGEDSDHRWPRMHAYFPGGLARG